VGQGKISDTFGTLIKRNSAVRAEKKNRERRGERKRRRKRPLPYGPAIESGSRSISRKSGTAGVEVALTTQRSLLKNSSIDRRESGKGFKDSTRNRIKRIHKRVKGRNLTLDYGQPNLTQVRRRNEKRNRNRGGKTVPQRSFN